MFPLKNYYESFIKKEIIGMKKEDVLKRLGNLLACPLITKDVKNSVHVRYFSCNQDGPNIVPNMDRWLGTIALQIKEDFVIDSAISVPKKISDNF